MPERKHGTARATREQQSATTSGAPDAPVCTNLGPEALRSQLQTLQAQQADLQARCQELSRERETLAERLRGQNAALEAAETKWRSLVGTVADLVLILAPDGVIQFANHATGGLRLEDVLGTHVYDWLLPEYRERTRACLEEVVRTGQLGHVEVAGLGREGQPWCCTGRIGPIREDGHIVALVCTAHDVTQRRQAAAAARAREARFRHLYEHSPVAVHSIDASGCVSDVNREWQRETGYAARDVIGREITSIMTLESAARATSNLQRLWREGCMRDVPYQFVRADGTVIDVSLNCIVTANAAGETVALCVLQNVTGRRQAEQALRRMSKVFMDGTDPIIITDLEGRILDLNAEVERAWEWKREELLGQSIKTLLPPEEQARANDLLARCLRGEDLRNVVGVHNSKSGAACPVMVTLSLLSDEFGQPVAIAAFSKDISKHAQVEERLRRSERLASIGVLAAGIAHEINNPAGAILMIAQSALEELEGSADAAFVKKCLHDIVGNAKRCGRVVKSVLHFARQQPSEHWPNDINALVNRGLDLTRDVVTEYRGRIVTRLSPDLPDVRLNPTEFEQVLINLIRNALEAGGEGTCVTLATERCGPVVRCTVSDDGPGMPPEQANRVFDPFYTTRQQRGGFGLGLSVVHGIVNAHGGRIDVASELGVGTTFTIDWPVNGPDGSC